MEILTWGVDTTCLKKMANSTGTDSKVRSACFILTGKDAPLGTYACLEGVPGMTDCEETLGLTQYILEGQNFPE